jgi:hypothetical protein
MKNPLLWVSLSRFAPGLAYLLAVGLVGGLIFFHNRPPAPMAAHDLGRNQKLAPGDLETSNIKPLLGQFLRSDVKQGMPVTEAMVAEKALPARIESTLAAVVTISLRSLNAQKISVGSDVQICLKNDAFGDVSKVITVDCDELLCMVLVKMPRVPGPKVDPDISVARLVTDPQGCSKATP